MANVKVVLNASGCREILNSPEVQEICLSAASAVESRATVGRMSYKTDVREGMSRCHARVQTASKGAYYQNLKHNYLIKALGGG